MKCLASECCPAWTITTLLWLKLLFGELAFFFNYRARFDWLGMTNPDRNPPLHASSTFKIHRCITQLSESTSQYQASGIWCLGSVHFWILKVCVRNSPAHRNCQNPLVCTRSLESTTLLSLQNLIHQPQPFRIHQPQPLVIHQPQPLRIHQSEPFRIHQPQSSFKNPPASAFKNPPASAF